MCSVAICELDPFDNRTQTPKSQSKTRLNKNIQLVSVLSNSLDVAGG